MEAKFKRSQLVKIRNGGIEATIDEVDVKVDPNEIRYLVRWQSGSGDERTWMREGEIETLAEKEAEKSPNTFVAAPIEKPFSRFNPDTQQVEYSNNADGPWSTSCETPSTEKKSP